MSGDMAKLAEMNKQLKKMEAKKTYLNSPEDREKYQMLVQQIEDLTDELYNDDIPF